MSLRVASTAASRSRLRASWASQAADERGGRAELAVQLGVGERRRPWRAAVDAPLHGRDQLVAGPAAEVALLEAPEPLELAGGRGKALGDRGDGQVGQHETRGQVAGAGRLLPPGGDLLGHGQLLAAQLAGLLDAGPGQGGLAGPARAGPQLGALRLGPGHPVGSPGRSARRRSCSSSRCSTSEAA